MGKNKEKNQRRKKKKKKQQQNAQKQKQKASSKQSPLKNKQIQELLDDSAPKLTQQKAPSTTKPKAKPKFKSKEELLNKLMHLQSAMQQSTQTETNQGQDFLQSLANMQQVIASTQTSPEETAPSTDEGVEKIESEETSS